MKKNFTLVELLVVIAILSLTASLLQPSIKKMSLAAKQIECSQNLKNIGLNIYQYVEENNNQYPGPLFSRIRSVTSYNLGKYLKPYYQPLPFDEFPELKWKKYIPELMCPKNKEECFKDDIRTRPQYQIFNRTSEKVWTFGRPRMEIKTGKVLTLIRSAYVNEISNFSTEKMMRDYDEYNHSCRVSLPNVPGYPIHGLGSRNVLFLDQHVEAVLVY